LALKIFITGVAGFIGYHVAQRLLATGQSIIGMDNLNDYYDVKLKADRLLRLQAHAQFTFYEMDLSHDDALADMFRRHEITHVIHLAAQAGVRYSLENPRAYIDSNVLGFMNILEVCRHQHVEHLIYASSSSVYGANVKLPFSVHDAVDHPVSLYAATKKSNELMAHTYSHLFQIPTTGLRFFTVYGPWGRPDMAYYSFTQRIYAGEKIQVYNHGEMSRDFTYIDDIVEGVVRLLPKPPQPQLDWDRVNPDPGSSFAPYRIYNIGNHQPVNLMTFIHTLEKHIGKQAIIEFMPMQPGDVEATFADIEALTEAVGFQPTTSLDEGLKQFVAWYRDYHDSILEI
jgi:UDP-glucuronate 4-epimerase